jgi:hypothetical protein
MGVAQAPRGLLGHPNGAKGVVETTPIVYTFNTFLFSFFSFFSFFLFFFLLHQTTLLSFIS